MVQKIESRLEQVEQMKSEHEFVFIVLHVMIYAQTSAALNVLLWLALSLTTGDALGWLNSEVPLCQSAPLHFGND